MKTFICALAVICILTGAVVLNMLSTGAMIRFGRVRGNFMAYMVPNNKKLVDRAIRMIMTKTGCDSDRAAIELAKADNIIADAIDAIEQNG